MGSENSSSGEAPPPEAEKQPEPAEVEEPVAEPAEEPAPEEEYEELIEPEKPKKPRKKSRHLGAIITVIVILVVLLLWTVLSPRILPSQGMTYVESTTYANLASFNDTLKSWAATTTWGVSAGTPSATSSSALTAVVPANETILILVLISKVSEKPSNFWFRGTAVSITNMTLVNSDTGGIVATMTNKSHLGYGELATFKFSLAPGHHNLSLAGEFLVYVDMRIGFLPVEKVSLDPEHFGLMREIIAA